MKNIKTFSLFAEAAVYQIHQKFPTEKAIHILYIYQILEEAGLNPTNLDKKPRSPGIYDFMQKKCSKNVPFPKVKIYDVDKRDSRYKDWIDRESIVELPKSYDAQLDELESIEHKMNFIEKMKSVMNKKTKEEEDKLVSDIEKNVYFGPNNYDWVNPALKIIYDKLSQYYINDKLNIWIPRDWDYKHWDTYDYPHKYDAVGNLSRPNGVYFLSDIEKFIENKYGLKDEHLYEYIIHNEYIEGRYWERVWSLHFVEDKGSGNPKIVRKGGKYGMDATENLNHILNIIEMEFIKHDFIKSKYEGFPIFIDYYKKVDQSVKNEPPEDDDWIE